MDRKTRW